MPALPLGVRGRPGVLLATLHLLYRTPPDEPLKALDAESGPILEFRHNIAWFKRTRIRDVTLATGIHKEIRHFPFPSRSIPPDGASEVSVKMRVACAKRGPRCDPAVPSERCRVPLTLANDAPRTHQMFGELRQVPAVPGLRSGSVVADTRTNGRHRHSPACVQEMTRAGTGGLRPRRALYAMPQRCGDRRSLVLSGCALPLTARSKAYRSPAVMAARSCATDPRPAPRPATPSDHRWRPLTGLRSLAGGARLAPIGSSRARQDGGADRPASPRLHAVAGFAPTR
jgi:hypothetical protein